MIKELLNKIKEYDKIIIHRHSRPDLDAIGSQLGLKQAIIDNYPNKKVYAVGDESLKYSFLGNMDCISVEEYNGALCIICDVAVKNMVSDDRYINSKEIYVIDHHKNECDITKNHIVDTSKVATAEFIADILFDNNLYISPTAATYLYGGIITDSGRFLYGSNLSKTLLVASKLVEFGANPKFIYDNIYVETLEEKQMKNYFSNKFEFKAGVAFLKNTQEVFEKFPREFNDISRGMLSVMSGIDEIKIWCNFTYDISKDLIIGEFRSRSIEIVEIAKKYGGGGHALACGASLASWEMVDEVINDFINLLNNGDNNES